MQNREIEFRAWDNRYNTWLKDREWHIRADGTVQIEVWNDAMQRIDFPLTQTSRFKLMQYADLHDSIQQEIWESDIVEDSRGFRGIVTFEMGYFQAWLKSKSGNVDTFVSAQALADCQVIGNIFNNPELLP